MPDIVEDFAHSVILLYILLLAEYGGTWPDLIGCAITMAADNNEMHSKIFFIFPLYNLDN